MNRKMSDGMYTEIPVDQVPIGIVWVQCWVHPEDAYSTGKADPKYQADLGDLYMRSTAPDGAFRYFIATPVYVANGRTGLKVNRRTRAEAT